RRGKTRAGFRRRSGCGRGPKLNQAGAGRMAKPQYKRVLIKVSGEALQGSGAEGLHAPTLARIAADIVEVKKLGVETAVMVGGGNIIRGAQLAGTGIDRAAADAMGMLATVINALALEGAIERAG